MDTSFPPPNAFINTAPGSDGRDGALAPPGHPNGGGTAIAHDVVSGTNPSDTPRLVIRGESFETQTPNPQNTGERLELRPGANGKGKIVAIPLPKEDGNPFAAITDFLNITFPFCRTNSNVREFLAIIRLYIGDTLGALTDRGRGLHGYKHSLSFEHGGAMLAYGGQSETAFLSLPGDACRLIPDWRAVVAMLRDILQARITRWDGAVDDYYGNYSVDLAVEWYKAGEFNAGGNKPSCSQAGNWIEPDGLGRTFYVGRRKNGKLMRIYEKGKQLGARNHPWVRWELELHNTDREIPYDVLLAPGKFVAGAYPCMAWVQKEASRIKTIQKTAAISYAHLSHFMSIAYGRLINAMIEIEGSPEKVIEKIRRPGLPARLQFPVIPDGEGFKK